MSAVWPCYERFRIIPMRTNTKTVERNAKRNEDKEFRKVKFAFN